MIIIKNAFKKVFAFIAGAFTTSFVGILFIDPLTKKFNLSLSSIPDTLAIWIMNPICREIPNYELKSIPFFASRGFVILCGVLIFHLILQVSSIIERRSHSSEDTQTSSSTLSIAENTSEEISAFYKLQDLVLSLFHKGMQKYSGHIALLLLIVAYIIIHGSFFKTLTVSSLATEMVKRIEIVSPYIEDLEYKKLKSKFYSIQDFYDYENLDKELDAIATTNNIS